MRLAFFVMVLGVAACAPAQDPEPQLPADRSQQSILGGAADVDSASVFLLDLRFNTGATSVCSATLVAPKVLLTAAHCVDPTLKGAASVMVKATNKPDATTLSMSEVIDVTRIEAHPNWNPSDSASPNDLAMLLLARAPVGVVPSGLVRAVPAGLVGQRIRVVGYGVTQAGGTDPAIRRAVTVPVTRLTASTVDFGASGTTGVCSGDSGGPSFLTEGGQERVISVHSRTNSAACGEGSDIRVDRLISFVDGFIQANDPATCNADGRCAAGCTPRDLDCPLDCAQNGVCETGCPTNAPDPDCAAAGAPCTDDGQCLTARCGTDPVTAARYCTIACLVGGAPCPAGLTCDASRLCLKPLSPATPLGDPCTPGTTRCEVDAVCSGRLGGASTCRPACGVGDACPEGTACVDGLNAARYCDTPVVKPPPTQPPPPGKEVSGGCGAAPGAPLASLLAWLALRRRRALPSR